MGDLELAQPEANPMDPLLSRGLPRGPDGPRSLKFSACVSGTDTDFVITDFGSKLFVVVTQSAKIGSLIEASQTELEGGGQKVFDVRVLFGNRQAEYYRLYARALIELVAKQSSKSVLLGIALKEHSMESFRQTVREIDLRIAPMAEPQPEDDDDLVP